MAGNLLFYYLGDDEAYYKTLQGEFRKSTRLPIHFKRAFESQEERIQSLFIKLFKEKPACVIIDFSKHTQDYLHLARIISRTPLEHKMLTIGLVDYLSPPEIMQESIATGVKLTHIKSAESFDLAFDVQRLLSEKDDASHGFATASASESWDAGIPSKIGYIDEHGIHFETDFKLNKGEKIRLSHYWQQKKIFPSETVFVKETSTSNLFYQFKYSADAEFLFVDELVVPEGMTPEEIQNKNSEREEQIHYYKKQLKKWIDDNVSRSLEKKAKVLVVDHSFPFYQNHPRTDKHSYTIRSIPFFSEAAEELDRLRPHVIAYSLEPEEVKDAKNNMENLLKLTSIIKARFPELNPFIVIFNTKISSKEMQSKLSYPMIMTHEGELSVGILERMAEVYDKKMSSLRMIEASTENKVFIKKNNPASVTEILIPIKVTKLSETDMVFQTDAPIQAGMNLHISGPIDMFVHVLPSKSQSKTPEYYGLIHGLGEVSKKELRKFINTVFFRDHDAQVEAETTEFKKLNETKLQEKMEKLQEEAQESETQEELERGLEEKTNQNNPEKKSIA